MVTELVQAFILIFIAELGDKSQILAMTFATKYKLKYVAIGVFLGIFLNHAIAVLFGSSLGLVFNSLQLNLISALIFLGFGFWSLLDKDGTDIEKKVKFGPIITISIAFFIGELGDKTQFATIALASQANFPQWVLVGTVSAMMTSSMLGILIGFKLGEKVPDFYMKVVSAVLFVGYGVVQLGNSTMYTILSRNAFIVLLVVLGILFLILLWNRTTIYLQGSLSSYQKVARSLKAYYNKMEISIQTICLGEEVCGVCQEKQCLIGHTKYLIEEAKKGNVVDVTYLKNPIVRNVSKQKVQDSLRLTVQELKEHWNQAEYEHIHLIRTNLERLLFNTTIKADNYQDYVEKLDKRLSEKRK